MNRLFKSILLLIILLCNRSHLLHANSVSLHASSASGQLTAYVMLKVALTKSDEVNNNLSVSDKNDKSIPGASHIEVYFQGVTVFYIGITVINGVTKNTFYQGDFGYWQRWSADLVSGDFVEVKILGQDITLYFKAIKPGVSHLGFYGAPLSPYYSIDNPEVLIEVGGPPG